MQMTREEAIAFLQEIKYNIDYLQAHYAQQRLKSATDERMLQDKQIQDEFNNVNITNMKISILIFEIRDLYPFFLAKLSIRKSKGSTAEKVQS